jgi:1-acyl-sn-glycerol-3-phosphate acyltransferase
VFAISFLVLYPFFFIAIKTNKLEVAFFLKRIWSFCIAFGSGILPKVVYESKSKKMPQPCVFVPNHTSYLDIVLSTFYIDHLAIYMGKSEGMDIPVKRTSRIDAHKAFTAAGNEIDKGRSMVIFPEGTISKQPKLMPFKNGAFKLAIDKQVPIVPIVNLNHKQLLENGGYFKSNGCCGIAKTIVLEPIQTKGLTDQDADTLKETVFNLIQNTLIKYNGK